MKPLPTIVVSFVLLLGHAGSGLALEQPPYIGDKAGFAAFAAAYGKTDWPLPKAIAYFDPSGGNGSVIRYAHWALPAGAARGVVVHFNGRKEFIERNIYTYKDLLDCGYEVWTFDWRGQGFSQRQIGEKQKHSIDSFDTYIADAAFFIDKVARVRESNGTRILLAHSMGGQIALRYLMSDRGRSTFDYAVLSSPLLRAPGDHWHTRAGNRIKTWLGLGGWCVFRKPDTWTSSFNEDSCGLVSKNSATETALADAALAKQYSNDWRKLADSNCMIESSKDARGQTAPDLRLACPTSDWLRAAFTSTDFVMHNFAKLATPTLIVRAVPDVAVDNAGQSEFCKLAKIACIDIQLEDGTQAGHELLVEVEPIRERFLREFDAFVQMQRQ